MAPDLTPQPPLQAPFPWFGGKSRAAPLIWDALGDVTNYVEPFAGSLAVLLNRPHAPQIETVNDKDSFLSNVWRAIQADPDAVAHWADWPVNEADQHAIHTWLVNQREEFTARLLGDPDYYDAKVAGRWLYGICCWIGSGWCSGNGHWQSVNGQLVKREDGGGVKRRLVHLGNAGQGVHRQLVRLSSAGQGVHRKLVHLGDAGRGETDIYAWMHALCARLRSVRVCCGDWTRVLGPSVTFTHGLTGIVLDPPYSLEESRKPDIYAVDDLAIAHAVRDWCLQNGAHPLLRIALCGYGEAHDALLPHGWRKVGWTANGGMGNTRRDGNYINKYRETIWFSPHTMQPRRLQMDLFS